jgi:hypothetical protein
MIQYVYIYIYIYMWTNITQWYLDHRCASSTSNSTWVARLRGGYPCDRNTRHGQEKTHLGTYIYIKDVANYVDIEKCMVFCNGKVERRHYRSTWIFDVSHSLQIGLDQVPKIIYIRLYIYIYFCYSVPHDTSCPYRSTQGNLMAQWHVR